MGSLQDDGLLAMTRPLAGRLRTRKAIGIAAVAVVVSGVVWVTTSGGKAPKSTTGSIVMPSQGLVARSCTADDFARIAWGNRPVGITQVECSDGWGLAAGSKVLAGHTLLFHHLPRGWIEVKDVSGGPKALESAPSQLADHDVTIGPALLSRLAEPFSLPIRQTIAAGLLVKTEATRVERETLMGVLASDVSAAGGNTWFAMAYPDSAGTTQPGPVGSNPYPNSTMQVYKWSPSGWKQQGIVDGWMGPVGGCCRIEAESYTGSNDPDFSIGSGGAADTNWFAIVSDIGGHWHLVPFDYGYTLTTVVNAMAGKGGVETMVDACSCASGPTTLLFETYMNGAFRPANPPGPQPKCSLGSLQDAADPGAFNVTLSDFACADGWALATGTGIGYSGPVVGLFQATPGSDSGDWRTVELDNGISLGSYPGIYDIPLTVLRHLANHFGAMLQPELATADLVTSPAMIGYTYVGGVLTVNGVHWYVAERPTGNEQNPGADATIYRWSGATWIPQGEVRDLPNSLVTTVGAFQSIAIPGTADPGFVLQPTNPAAQDVLTDLGGKWHYAPLATNS